MDRVGVAEEKLASECVIANQRKELEMTLAAADDYMEEWGHPRTRRRLWRIAHHLARLVRNRQSNPIMTRAVDDWVHDLDWLEEEFYRPWMAFTWPSTRMK